MLHMLDHANEGPKLKAATELEMAEMKARQPREDARGNRLGRQGHDEGKEALPWGLSSLVLANRRGGSISLDCTTSADSY